MHHSHCRLRKVFEETGIRLAFLLGDLEIQLFILLEEVGDHSSEHSHESHDNLLVLRHVLSSPVRSRADTFVARGLSRGVT